MNQLIPIQDRCGKPTVNARDLHKFLEVGKDFSNWIKDRIGKYGFVLGADYAIFQDLSSPNLANAKSRAQVQFREVS